MQSIWHTLFEQLMKSDSGIGDKTHRYKNVLQYPSWKVTLEKACTCYQATWFFLLEEDEGSTTKS